MKWVRSLFYLILIANKRNKLIFTTNCFALLDLIKKCWLHVGRDASNEKVIPFNDKTLRTCNQKREIRRQTQKKASKYDSIVLPEHPDGVSGYHSTCYKSYTSAVVKKSNSADDTSHPLTLPPSTSTYSDSATESTSIAGKFKL